MKGLLLKDFYTAQKYCRSFLLILIVFISISFSNKGFSPFSIYPVLLAGMLPVTLVSYDEREKWNIYCETLPYKRSQIVIAKYLTGFILVLAVCIPSSASLIYRNTTAGLSAFTGLPEYAMMVFSIGLIGPSVLMPFIFLLGTEKGRLIFYAVIALLFSALAVFTRMNIDIKQYTQSDFTLVLITICVLIFFACSCGLSVLFYKRREL